MKKQVIGKYEFPTKEAFEIAFDLLHNIDEEGNRTPKFYFSDPVIIKIPLEEAEFDSEGNLIKEATFQDTINVDMSWWLEVIEHPEGWSDYAIDISTEGLHSLGISYLENKI